MSPTPFIASLTRRHLVLGGLALSTRARAADELTIRFGHFPNITHIQGLVAHALTRAGDGWFERRLGPGVNIDWYVYNAGPSAIEALFAKSIDVTYIGPSPAINGYARSRGDDIRILAGAAEGGAGLVVKAGSALRTPADFRGKRIATPQLGNTQDVSARAWLVGGGLHITMTGGDAEVIPTANPDQLTLFQSGQLDGVWTVEPWLSRLEREAGGRLLIDEADSVTTVLVCADAFLQQRRDIARKLVAANAELTEWIKAHPDDAKRLARDELKAETRADMDPALIDQAWAHIKLTPDVSTAAMQSFVDKAKSVGFLRNAPDLARLVQTP